MANIVELQCWNSDLVIEYTSTLALELLTIGPLAQLSRLHAVSRVEIASC